MLRQARLDGAPPLGPAPPLCTCLLWLTSRVQVDVRVYWLARAYVRLVGSVLICESSIVRHLVLVCVFCWPHCHPSLLTHMPHRISVLFEMVKVDTVHLMFSFRKRASACFQCAVLWSLCQEGATTSVWPDVVVMYLVVFGRAIGRRRDANRRVYNQSQE